ncbi:MAG: hypothetical protein ABI536_04760 [Gallionella sp.]
MKYNSKLLNQYFAPGITEFIFCDAPDITNAHPEAPHWLANHFLNSLLRGAYKKKYRQYAINQIYRAQVAFADYHEARKITLELLAKANPENPDIRLYFHAVSRWESCLLNLQIFIEVMNELRKIFKEDRVYITGDGSPEERVCEIANMAKHLGSEIAAGSYSEDHTVPIWLTNIGLKTRSHEVTYQELANLVSEVAVAADELQDPRTFVNPN